MSNPDMKRIQTQEGAYTFSNYNSAKMLKEIDARLNGAEVYTTITRTSLLISKIEYFSDLARTKLVMELQITYTGSLFIDTFTYIFYNEDGSEDSRVTETTTRDGDERVTSCDSVFTTTEDTKL